jgi:hypothetical protein
MIGRASGKPEEACSSIYILFECRFARDLFCAVPSSSPIPDFLVAGGWKFRGTLGKRGLRQSGFRASAARTAVCRDGFYLFVSPSCKA